MMKGKDHARTLVAFIAAAVAFVLVASVALLANPASAYAAEAKAELKATKTLDGGTLEADQFEFTIEAVTEGAPMPANTTAKNDAEGNISFGEATYTTAGTYEYKVTETKGSDSTITYDSEAKTITVTVTEKTADSNASAVPNNGDNYLPQKHNVSSTYNAIYVDYDHGTWPLEAGWYSAKSVKFSDADGGATENVFCGANYKSGSASDAPKRSIWNADLSAYEDPVGMSGWQGIMVHGSPSDSDYKNFSADYPRWLDRVAYLYSYDYHTADYSGANGAWANSSDPQVMRGWALRDAVQKVMWNCYPYNAGNFDNTGALRKTTQEALFFVLKCGQGYIDGTLDKTAGGFRDFAPDQDMFDKVIDFALKGADNGLKNYPEGTETYVYWNTATPEDAGGASGTNAGLSAAQPLIGIYAPYEATSTLSAEATTAAFTNKKTSGGGDDGDDGKPSIKTSAKGASGNTIEAAPYQEITDTVTYSNLEADTKYQLEGLLMDKDTKELISVAYMTDPVQFTTTSSNAASGTQEVKFTFDATELAGKSIVVYEHLYTLDADGNPSDEPVAKHEDINDAAQTVTVKNPGEEDEPTPTSGTLKTTVKVGGNRASSDALLTLPKDQASSMAVIDTIDYEGLTAGAEYKVTGTLMCFNASNTSGTAVATKEETLTADAASGSWVLNFGMVDLQTDSYYVVYEEAVNTKDAADKAEHKDVSDTAQAVVVEDAPNIEIENPENPNNPFNPSQPGVPTTSINELKMATTVDIDGKAATANAPRTVAYSDASKVKKVNDTVTYSGFGTDEKYTLRGELVDVTDANNPKVIKETTQSDLDAEANGGTWTMTFDGVTIEQGHKYVVFEYATDSAGNQVAKHADASDNAQTVVVTAKPTAAVTSSSTTAKTADTATGVAFASLLVALVAASGLAVSARRKSER